MDGRADCRDRSDEHQEDFMRIYSLCTQSNLAETLSEKIEEINTMSQAAVNKIGDKLEQTAVGLMTDASYMLEKDCNEWNWYEHLLLVIFIHIVGMLTVYLVKKVRGRFQKKEQVNVLKRKVFIIFLHFVHLLYILFLY